MEKEILFFGKLQVIACDGKCEKAWGINRRPRVQFSEEDVDDFAYLADDELGEAPQDPGTYEGGYAKPSSPEQFPNKWCARERERSFFSQEQRVPDFSRRLYNDPNKHPEIEQS